MDMREPSTAWDRPTTDAELNTFYGTEKSTAIRDGMIEVITKTVRDVPSINLSLPYVKYDPNFAKVATMPFAEVVTEYGTDPKPLAALLAVIEKSDCPLVEAFRQALAERYADAWANDVREVTQ